MEMARLVRQFGFAPWIVPIAKGPTGSFFHVRFASRYEAFDARFDSEELQAARQWRQSFSESSLPKGNTSFSRSSGPGGQYVNKTESKATTSWSSSELAGVLPKLLRPKLATSKHYVKNTDSISFQAQTQRSRSANTEDNRKKLYEEILRIYDETIPGESSPDKAKKYKAAEKAFNEKRLKEKKKQSSKKSSRRGPDF